jgi:uncharacterized protein
MPLLVNLQHLARHDVSLEGELPQADLDLDVHDAMVRPGSPLLYELEVEKLEQAVLAQGRLEVTLDCQCVRCLKAFKYPLILEHWACHLPLEGEDATPVINDCVDLTPPIREDILLGFPHHPVCQPGCSGLKAAERVTPEQPGDAKGSGSSATWAELDKLKL